MTDVVGAEASRLSPVQSGLRFLLEVAALICWGGVGWSIGDGPLRWVLAMVFAVAPAMVWGTFRVPGDLSASGRAPMAVPGIVRLILESDILIIGGVLAAVLWSPALGIAVVAGTVIHYAATRRRVAWLVSQRGPTPPPVGADS